MTPCPTCGKPVDALRARNVKVRGIQVVAYCSPECLAAAGDSAAVATPEKRAATPAGGVVKQGGAPDSGPVIEIRYEPASGVVTSTKDERAPVPAKVPEEAGAKPDPKPDKRDDKKAEHKDDKKAEKKDKKAEKKAEKDDRKPDDKKTEKADDKRERKPGDPKPTPVLKIIEEAGGTPRAITPPQGAKILDPAPGEKLSPAQLAGSGTSLEPGKRRLSRETLKRDNANVAQGEDWLDDEPANEGSVRAGTELGEGESGGGTKRALVVLLVLALLAVGGVLIYKFVIAGKANAKTGSGSGTGAVGATPGGGSGSARIATGSQQVEAPADAAPVVDPQTRATAVLKHWLGAKDSPRIQRLAAAALSRTGDQTAKDRLATALQADKLEDAGRHEVAYALARAGDKRGLDAMTAALAAPRRDDKLTVGRLLVQLGDQRAINALAPYLELPQHRLGAAEWLARLGEPRAIKVLEQIRADDKASADDKARATIALAHGGKAGLEAELHALLTDPRFNVFAAEVLAIKRDEAARPVLVKQLDVTSLRVGAARALRALKPDGDHAAEIKLLLVALDDPNTQRDTEQVSIAEAILLLAGDPSWAART